MFFLFLIFYFGTSVLINCSLCYYLYRLLRSILVIIAAQKANEDIISCRGHYDIGDY